MRLLFILIVIINFLIAEDKKVEVKSSELKMIVELIKLNQDTINSRFEDMNKRFEDMNKRFEDMQKHTDKRFEDINKRFEDMQKHTDKRFEDIHKRFDNVFTLLGIILTVMVAGFGIIITYLIKERNTIGLVQKDLQIEVEKIDNSLKKKADKKVVEKIVEIIERLAKDNNEIQDILKKHHLSYQNN